MIHLGYDNLARNAAKLNPASKNIVQAHIDKVRPNLPAKPPPTAAPSTAVRGKAPVSPSKETSKESDDGGKAPPGKVVRAPSKTKVKICIFFALLQSCYVFTHFFTTFLDWWSLCCCNCSPRSKKWSKEGGRWPILPLNNLKSQRVTDEVKLRVLKWNLMDFTPNCISRQ